MPSTRVADPLSPVGCSVGPSCVGLCPECLNQLESGEFGGQPILLVIWTSHYAVANTDAYM